MTAGGAETGRRGIYAARAGRHVHVRVVGRVTYQNSQPLRHFAMEALQHGGDEFYIDLGRCEWMDSTFLGVLTGIGLRLRARPGGRLRLFNVSPRNQEVLRTLGLDRLLPQETAEPPPAPPGEVEYALLPGSDPDARPLPRAGTAAHVLEAHEDLAKADQGNEPRFADVTRLLREEIAQGPTEEKK